MRVLIVRLSSMGDVVHTLPALTDAARAIPGLRFDWAVDEAFAQIPAWHTSVDNVFPTALRRWGRNLGTVLLSEEFKTIMKTLRRERYDLIVDLQGEFKSALVARMARGVRCGYDDASVHERGAQLVYRKKFSVPKSSHSIQRMRRLLAQALGYSFTEEDIDYHIDRTRLKSGPLEIPGPYVVFIHSTSWKSKNWPEAYWQELVRKTLSAGFRVVLPWGDEAERERSIRIAAGDDRVVVLPRLSISEKASIIERAAATVGLDTGLSHIAAALGVPSVTLYGATDPFLCGTIGERQIHVASDFECVKCHEEKCSYTKPSEFKPACFVSVKPERVWIELQALMKPNAARSKELYHVV
jgi:heptosyltransferase-1